MGILASKIFHWGSIACGGEDQRFSVYPRTDAILSYHSRTFAPLRGKCSPFPPTSLYWPRGDTGLIQEGPFLCAYLLSTLILFSIFLTWPQEGQDPTATNIGWLAYAFRASAAWSLKRGEKLRHLLPRTYVKCEDPKIMLLASVTETI